MIRKTSCLWASPTYSEVTQACILISSLPKIRNQNLSSSLKNQKKSKKSTPTLTTKTSPSPKKENSILLPSTISRNISLSVWSTRLTFALKIKQQKTIRRWQRGFGKLSRTPQSRQKKYYITSWEKETNTKWASQDSKNTGSQRSMKKQAKNLLDRPETISPVKLLGKFTMEN